MNYLSQSKYQKEFNECIILRFINKINIFNCLIKIKLRNILSILNSLLLQFDL